MFSSFNSNRYNENIEELEIFTLPWPKTFFASSSSSFSSQDQHTLSLFIFVPLSKALHLSLSLSLSLSLNHVCVREEKGEKKGRRKEEGKTSLTPLELLRFLQTSPQC